MSERLFRIIQAKVYKTDEIREVSMNSQDVEKSWIFDFKSVSLSKEFLKDFSDAFWASMQETFGQKPVQVGGMETGAIPLLAGVSLFAPHDRLANSFYIRKSRKKSDLANQVEGDILPDVPIVLVDDIINNGNTLRKQVKILEEKGHAVASLFACLRFQDMDAYKDLLDKGMTIRSIFQLDDFKDVLPVRNLKPAQPPLRHGKYEPEWKVTLTNKPNLYAVIPKSGPVISRDHIYMGVDDGTFYCLNKHTGDVMWTYKVLFGAAGKRIFSTPAVHKDKVIFGAYDGNLYCLNAETGKREWVFMDADWIGSSPCVDPDKGIVFIGLEFGLFKKRGGVAALSVATGKVLWKNYSMEGLTHASPAYSKKHNIVVCGCNDMFVYAFDASDGKVVWKFKTEGEVKYGAVFDDRRGVVVIASMDGGVYVLNSKDGVLYHKYEGQAGFYSTPAIVDTKIIIGSLDKKVYCFDLDSRNTIWKFETSGRIFASPVIIDNSVFIGSNDGLLRELSVTDGKIHSQLQFTERIVNKIAPDLDECRGVIYIPTHVGELYKVKIKK